MRLAFILEGYIGRHFLVSLVAVILAIMGLVLVFDLIELTRRASAQADITFASLLVMALLKQPEMLNTVLPFGIMLGGMVVFWRLSRSHELVVLRSAGVSAWQFLAPIILLVFAIGVFNVMAINPLAAALYSRYERMEDSLLLRRTNPFTLSQSGMWLREGRADSQMVVHAGNVRQDGYQLLMRDVSIFVFEEQDRFVKRIEARTAVLADGRYDLASVWVMQPGAASVPHDTLSLPTQLSLAKVQENFAAPETLSFWQLPDFIRFFESAGFSAHKHRLYFQSLFASPFLLCAMVLVAAAFSMRPNQRSGGILRRAVGGIVAGFVLYFFSKVTYALGLGTTLPLWLAAWSPAIVTSLLGLASLFHYEDG
ncbi:MAG: LPS export ABC transporter permease LptG [Alphaproteobacteria bacterium]